jgi:hypothetical protein
MRPALALVGLFALPFYGCSLKGEPAAPFEIMVRVASDPGHPLPGAVVTKGGKEGPSTGTDGKVTVKIAGQEGESVDLMIKCPPDYVSPTKPITVSLRRIAGSKLPEYETSCPPAVRHLVVAVRADNGPNIPVRILDRVVGRTDVNGAFTYALPLRPGDGVELTLDTTGIDRISPKNPSAPIVMKAFDDVVTFDQKFQWAEAKKTYRPQAARPTQIGPRRGFP